MAWDDNKDPDDLIRSNEWDNMVSDQKGHASRHESSGSDSIDHDLLFNYVANEHIDHSTVNISAGTHLTGGGDIAASRTLNVDETGIEVDNLAGNNGTNGQFLQTDGSALSFTDLTVRDIQQLINNQAVIRENLARNNFEDNLTELNYQGGFFDIFRNTSKIFSSSNVNVKTLESGRSGIVELKEIVDIIDGFEDGDVSEWSVGNFNGGTWSATSSNPITGTYSGLYEGNDLGEYQRSIPDQSPDVVTVKMRPNHAPSGASNDKFDFQILDSNGNRMVRVVFDETTGEIQPNFQSSSFNWEQDTTYLIDVLMDYANNQFDLKVDGSIIASGVAFDNSSGNQIGNFAVLIDTRNGGQAGMRYDDMGKKTGNFNTSGSIVEREDLSSGDDDFSNPPDNISVNQRADIPPDEDVQYVVRDVNGSGTDTTITQVDVGTQVDISDFTGFLVEVETQYSSSDGNDTPTHYSQDFYFEEGS